MIGQRGLIEQIDKMIENGTIPKMLVICAPRLHGRKMLAEYIAKKLKADLYKPQDLKVDSVRQIIEDSRSLTNKRLYLLADAGDMTVQAQNALLKLAEEPTPNAYIVMTLESIDDVLGTIRSRSQVLRMEAYTRHELEQFTQDEVLLDVCENPGQIKKYSEIDIKRILGLCEKIATSIGKITAANAFKILSHAHKEEYELLIPMLLYTYGKMVRDGNKRVIGEIKVLYDAKDLLRRSSSVNLQNLLETTFVKMREEARKHAVQ